ncbi:MAG: methyl-accepting chemotaxis protein [Syntrophobacteraceae bacterium]|nr:methyl-accepting chemotaxis protein [Syntrophobacteraceae bacterium]
MFRNIRLSYKISLGFASILLLTIGLGSIALWNMKGVEHLSVKLDHEYVPEVAVANNVERYSLETMFEMRGYGLTQEKAYLAAGNKNLLEVKKYLEEARRLSASSPELVKLKEGVGQAEAKVKEYEQLVDETIKKNEQYGNLRKTMADTAEKFMNGANDYLKTMNDTMKSEINSSSNADKLLKRLDKINIINNVIERGNWTRIANLRFQAMNDPKYVEEALKHLDDIETMLVELNKMSMQEQNKKALGAISAAAGEYKQAMRNISSTWHALRELNKKRAATGDQFVQVARKTALAGMEHASDIATTASTSLSSASRILTAGLIVVLWLGIGMASLIVRSITRPIRLVVDGLAGGADQVASAASQVSGSSQQLAEGASEQAASIEETSSSLEEMSSMTRQNAEHAGQANTLMAETGRVVIKANRSMDKLTASMLEITKASEETSKIVKTIDAIAFQTNLLALNAAVEAARAGEAGAGFAVVADEVRNLAMRAAEAAKNTASLIEGTVKNIKEGSELVEETGADFSQVAASARKMSELISDISAASTEQAQGIDQVNKAVGEMDKVVQQNAANAEESASAAEEMNSQAEQMKSFVGELVAIVDGSGDGNTRDRKSKGLAPNRRLALLAPRKPGHSAAELNKVNGTQKTFQPKSEDLIPFGEEDGKVDF